MVQDHPLVEFNALDKSSQGFKIYIELPLALCCVILQADEPDIQLVK